MNRTTDTPSILLGRYRVLATNTTGGFGTVNVCWDPRLQRRVAIKQMPLLMSGDSPESSAQSSSVNEALGEARTSSMLAHPNIVTVYDFESDEEYSYLVMEYVDGLNLAELLSRVEDGVLSFDECAHLVDSLASALAYAHENGVLHLDIKPSNIIIDRSGTVKLADFGMANLASAAGFGGARGGTVGYMPPEQIRNKIVDERTDIFSFAVVVWEALTGSCPYAAPTPEKSLGLILHGPSPALSRVEPSLAGIVENTLLHALEPNPAARTSSVSAFARDLVPALGDAQEGADSLSDLLGQTEEDDESHPLEDWNRFYVPLGMRHPWLAGALPRLLAAAVTGWIVYNTIPFILPRSQEIQVFGAVGMAAACAAWPPLSGALGVVSIVGAILAQPATYAFPLALVIGLLGGAWWILAGRRDYMSGPALWLPSCLRSPLAGVALSGMALDPAPAFFTGALSLLFYHITTAALDAQFYADALLGSLRSVAAEPRVWILSVACGLAALTGSLFFRRQTFTSITIGQIMGITLLALAYVMCAHMENANIADALDVMALWVAVFLGATLCIAVALLGESAINRKGDDRA